MPTLVATAGSASANSFATIAEGDTWCDARLNADAWNDETDDDQKARALIGATLELSSRNIWQGKRATTTQALSWPRFFAPNPDDPWGLYFDSSIVPQRVKNATMELALIYLAAGTTDLMLIDPNVAVVRKTIGPITTEWATFARARGLERFPSVMQWLWSMTVNTSGNVIQSIRG